MYGEEFFFQVSDSENVQPIVGPQEMMDDVKAYYFALLQYSHCKIEIESMVIAPHGDACR